MTLHEYFATAAIAFALTNLAGLEGLRGLMSAWWPTSKLARCSFCAGLWIALAVQATDAYPWTMFYVASLGAGVGIGLTLSASLWSDSWIPLQTHIAAGLLGALLAALGAGVCLPLLDGAAPSTLLLGAFPGALVSLATVTAIQAGMGYVSQSGLDDF